MSMDEKRPDPQRSPRGKRLTAFLPRSWAAIGAVVVLVLGFGFGFVLRKESFSRDVILAILLGLFALLMNRVFFPASF
jgi:fatty acid desaturase